ncbi:hypothetical protein Lfu02_77640 [Longispora fulva]|uniref:Uncharacterized protein n=1 Tax=Longispora fulva TaxID=619741 RepID=A0A8J7KPE5_9ACTN|nr:hypothetical protein [Longispora fulva]MBG6136212.1 hypothetical protein [Longispora fulva]GIG63392.1 hypothetical protein Lfu02_77640 [Longispora fulva]
MPAVLFRFPLAAVLGLSEHATLSPDHAVTADRTLPGPALILRTGKVTTLASSGRNNPHSDPVAPVPAEPGPDGDAARPASEHILDLDASIPMTLHGVREPQPLPLSSQLHIAHTMGCAFMEIELTATGPVIGYTMPRPSDAHTTGQRLVNVNNRAFQRFLALLPDHFDVNRWEIPDTGQTVAVLLTDAASGDSFQVAFLDSAEPAAPSVLITIDLSGAVRAVGVYPSQDSAADSADDIAAADESVAMSVALILNDPVAAGAWLPVTGHIVEVVHQPDEDFERAVVLLVDHARLQLAATGPFPDRASAEAFAAQAGRGIGRIVAPLRDAQPPF